nr:MAG TPA: hypothetical protein [Microviridae sp.]
MQFCDVSLLSVFTACSLLILKQTVFYPCPKLQKLTENKIIYINSQLC